MNQSFGPRPRLDRRVKRLYKIGTVKVLAYSKAEAKRMMMAYLGTTEIKKGERIWRGSRI